MILKDLGFKPGEVAGPDYWLAPSGRNLYFEAIELEKKQAALESSI